MTGTILVLNAGSSSIKFALYPKDGAAKPALSGVVDRIGSAAEFALSDAQDQKITQEADAPDHASALDLIAGAINHRLPSFRVAAIGHRVVHGGAKFSKPVELTQEVIEELEELIPLAPLHLPHGIRGAKEAGRLFPDARQIGCFDTAFHAGKPWLHDSFGLPQSYYEEGVRRYGFHGLSCQSIMRQLNAEGYPVNDRRIVIAHLGNGCSATAVLGGVSHATSMGFSTLDGLLMGTRCGAIDPGVLLYWLQQGKDAGEIEDILYRRSGLLGLSEMSNDMRDLEASDSPLAKRAIDAFVARLSEEIARLSATMGGLDAVVFCGGIGENAASIRERVIHALDYLAPGGLEALVRATKEEHEIMLETQGLIEFQ